jgi:hypothetical protein
MSKTTSNAKIKYPTTVKCNIKSTQKFIVISSQSLRYMANNANNGNNESITNNINSACVLFPDFKRALILVSFILFLSTKLWLFTFPISVL